MRCVYLLWNVCKKKNNSGFLLHNIHFENFRTTVGLEGQRNRVRGKICISWRGAGCLKCDANLRLSLSPLRAIRVHTCHSCSLVFCGNSSTEAHTSLPHAAHSHIVWWARFCKSLWIHTHRRWHKSDLMLNEDLSITGLRCVSEDMICSMCV